MSHETITHLIVQDYPLVFPQDPFISELSDMSDHDFVFNLAYQCLEQEALAARSEIARQQIGHLLARLQGLDWRG